MSYLGSVNSVSCLLKYVNFEFLSEYQFLLENNEFSNPLRQFYGVWFRGHSSQIQDVQPRVFRKTNFPSIVDADELENGTFDETSLVSSFQLHLPEHAVLHSSLFDWLCLMQEHGAPTRLLDWTEHALVALHFAVVDEQYDDEPGELIILNGLKLNHHVLRMPVMAHTGSPSVEFRASMAANTSLEEWANEIERTLPVDINVEAKTIQHNVRGVNPNEISTYANPIAVMPRRLNERMKRQAARFTLHGGKTYQPRSGSPLPSTVSLFKYHESLTEEGNASPFIIRLCVPADYKRRIRSELRWLGIRNEDLFPEIDHQARHLGYFWTRSHADVKHPCRKTWR
ncbi:FRG domain-containing protein [uncultured Gimesia sp.]|uniref:FRG domain-containing protein n=1 Tax=uncultured Gimesia sp. TaxID=1678688 RepID=UPI002627733F|nr:FRG domain-containing protein [uncultured Gimesia sp.]